MTDVLVALDATAAAEPLLRTAALVSQALGRTLRAVHAQPWSSDLEGKVAASGVALELLSGSPEDAVLQATADPEVDLVVVGLHASPGGPAPGHIVRALAGRVTVPMIVVPPSAPARRAPVRVLFALDGTRRVSAAMRPVIAGCVAAGIEVLALHVYEPATVPRFHDGPEDELVWCEEFLAQHVADLDISLMTRPGPFVPALLECAAGHDVDLIAMPAAPGEPLARGSVLRQLLMKADRPVALVPLTRVPADRQLPGPAAQHPGGNGGVPSGVRGSGSDLTRGSAHVEEGDLR